MVLLFPYDFVFFDISGCMFVSAFSRPSRLSRLLRLARLFERLLGCLSARLISFLSTAR
ncbi:hypothetical protein EVA_17200 [gut metagenome]|uniref:Uncharacterized protein n=1 Tax=gut metagenome TaxID=749906 RepID=J9FJU6_9ZZZZ